jgi:hypothetical protein
MSEPESQNWQSTVYVIALDVEKAAVLLQQNDDCYTLPHFTVEGGVWETTVAKMQEVIGPTLQIEGQALYRTAYEAEEAICRGEAVIVLEAQASQKMNGEWLTRQALADIALANPAHCSLLEQVLDELETGQIPEKRPSWARPGWQRAATEWMTAELSRAGWTPTGPTELVRTWALSYVMRIQASNGDSAEKEWFYFKTSLDLPLFVNEAVVTKGLAALYPGYVPRPFAIDAAKNWMVLEDFGPMIGHGAPLDDRLRILEQYGAMQVKSAEQVEALVALGCCDRRLNWMVEEIKALFNNQETGQAITAEEAAQLRSMIAPLQRMCRKLSDYAVPDALIHGDLHGGNVAGTRGEGGQLIYFDWTDSAVSHPFFDMLLIYIAKDTAEQEKMRDVYLAHWLDFEPMERLLEVWRLAEALAAVYHAISYRYILEGLEEWGKNELDRGLPYWLRKILEHGEFIREH